ncbi:MAG: hypothetical protein WAN77_10560 [Thermoplasmata archaeon]
MDRPVVVVRSSPHGPVFRTKVRFLQVEVREPVGNGLLASYCGHELIDLRQNRTQIESDGRLVQPASRLAGKGIDGVMTE